MEINIKWKVRSLVLLILPFSGFAIGQSVSLALSSGSGVAGSVVNLSLSLSSTVTQPSAVQWKMTYSTSDFSALTVSIGAAATAAGKTISCNNTAGVSTCVVSGINVNTIANGVVATMAFTISSTAPDASSAIPLSNGKSVSAGGSTISTTATGGTVTIIETVTGMSCTPDSVIPPAPSTCLVTISSPAPAGGTAVSLSSNSPNAIVQPTLAVPAGFSSASFPVATSTVASDTTAQLQASIGASSASFGLSLVAASPTGVTPDATVSQNSVAAGLTIVSPALTTNFANELVLAFVSGGSASGTLTVNTVTGGGLVWALAKRTNTQKGTAEIWRAFAPTVLSGVTVTATFSTSVYSSITVMSFAGVDPTGSSGSGAIGATASASAATGAPTVSLTTTRDGSLVMGVGTDPTNVSARTPGSFQNVVSQDLSPNNNTFWVQTDLNTTPLSGTAVTLNDLSPTADAYNLTAVEILAPSYCIPTLVPTTRSFPVGGGSTTSLVATGPGCTWTSTTDSPTWITFNGGSGTGNGSFTYTLAANGTGQARLGTVSVSGQSFEAMEGGSTPIFQDVPVGTQFFDYIAIMYSRGITAGCQASPLIYCPTSQVTRAEMAVFVISALENIDHAAGGLPKTYSLTPYFTDVPATNQFFPFVQRLADRGITNGCTATTFCPDQPINQGQMAKFIIIGWMQYFGLSSFTYTETPYFTDVPSTDIFFSYVQKMMDLGIWTGCGGGQYCETSDVTRGQMAPMVLRGLVGAP